MPTIDDQYSIINNIILTEQGLTPSTPPVGKQRLYVSASGLKLVDSNGNVNSISTGIFNTVEVNLGSVPRMTGKFIITSASLVINKPVMVSQSSGSITGKGTRRDENEMDHLSVSGIVTTASNIECYWSSPTRVRGNFKFDYLVSS